MSPDVVSEVRRQFQEKSDNQIKNSGKRFFKEEIKSYGIRASVVHQISKDLYRSISNPDKNEIFKYCETLWQSGYIEESLVACNWSYACRKQFLAEDFEVFSKWIHLYVQNWASCDTFCTRTLAAFIEKYPDYIENLKEFTKSKNRWVRRASAVTLIPLARKGSYLKEVLEIALLLLEDSDDMVQKGYGWLLKEASKKQQQDIFEFVVTYKSRMPRTALRYAIEKMPDTFKKVAMQKD